MRWRFTVCTIMAVALILMAQAAMAGTRIYVNFGLPAVQFEINGGGAYSDNFRVEGSYCPAPVAQYPQRVYVVHEVVPQPEYIWIEGYYRWARPHYVWVPGHWARPSHPREVVYTQKHFNRSDQQHQDWGKGDVNTWDRHEGRWDHRD